MIKVFVVDDSAVVRETLSHVLSTDPEIEISGTASDPLIAMKKLETITPDVLIVDIEMPRMDGLSFLRHIMQNKPMPVIICSSMAEDGSLNALHALEYGAVEIIQKPKLGTRHFIEESKIMICDAVRAAYMSRDKISRKTFSGNFSVEPKLNADVILPKSTPNSFIETTEKVVVVGASTGGTEALSVFLQSLPPDSPGIVIVQHMPEKFTGSFAERLDSLCRIHVAEAKDNDSVVRGTALIAPGNKHTLLKRSGSRYFVEVRDGPLVSRHRPSVDVLFRSAARYAGKNAVGVIMTGMGDDGARGLTEMHDNGSYTIAQDEKTCVVFGMPQEAIKAGAVDTVLPLQDIAGDMLIHAR